jgi:hypothetical protein
MPVHRMTRPGFWIQQDEAEMIRACQWRDAPPDPQPFMRTGAVVFGEPARQRTPFTLLDTKGKPPLQLRKISIVTESGVDLLRGMMKLHVKKPGVYSCQGYNKQGQVDWMFRYLVQPIEKRSHSRGRVSSASNVSLLQ